MGFKLNGRRLRDFLAKREIDNLEKAKKSLEKARERKAVILKAKKETAEARIALKKLQSELDDIPDITSSKRKAVSQAGKSLKAVGKAATGKRTQTALKNLGKNLMEFSKHSEKYSKGRKPKRKTTKKSTKGKAPSYVTIDGRRYKVSPAKKKSTKGKTITIRVD